jgi:microcystin-dependent protein
LIENLFYPTFSRRSKNIAGDILRGKHLKFVGNFSSHHLALYGGQLMSILSNKSLLSIINIAYSGDGRTIFALPNLMGHESIYPGHGLGHLAQVSLKKNRTTSLITRIY